MAELITMPKLGFDMAEGKLVRWVKKQGEPVNKGEVLAEVETDKATVEVESFVSGVVAATFAEEGSFQKVGALIAVIAAPGEAVDVESLRAQAGGKTKDEGQKTTISQPSSVVSGQPSGKSNGQPTPAVSASTFLRISPIARRMADELGIDPRQVKGSGPEGRVTKKDIEAHLAAKAAPAPVPSFPAFPSVSIAREDITIPLTKLRSAIARRMTESKTSVPHFYVTVEVDMEAVLDLRKQLNAMLGDPPGGKLSVNDFVVKAAALVLRDYPNLNASFNGDHTVRHGHINIGNAVSVEAGLLTVVVKDADAKSLAQISAEVKAMAVRARDGKVKPDDVDGSTFTISNLGMYDVDSFVAIINPPDAAILAVGSARQTPVVKDGALTVGWRMKATISADHRVTDGAEAAQFMQALKKKLEEPLRLML
ncbi:MAG: 2-oxo acid dehydrogenase subunit E2 [Chloroflexi bacterium]|nr:2-oxo acid dehydrogenase subunit E2 [Chloroflexota bacterium]